MRAERAYIRTGRKWIRAMPLDCNDGAALRAAPVKGPDPKLRNEFCPQVSPSQVRDACGPDDGNEHTRRAIALAWKIHDFISTKGLAMVQIRCLRGFDTTSEAFA